MIKKFLFPKRISFEDSPYNKNISLVDCFPEPTLVVDGLIESGTLLRHIWHTALKNFIMPWETPKKILILGVGGGSNVRLVSQFYPAAKIDAVEVDSQIINIANDYFNLKEIKNLKIIRQDAIDFANSLKVNNLYDLILVDCFVGKNIPAKVQDLDFLIKLSKHTKLLLVNRIWHNEHHQETVFFLKKMRQYFIPIIVHTKTNILINLI